MTVSIPDRHTSHQVGGTPDTGHATDPMRPVGSGGSAGRIGPNAVSQTLSALDALHGHACAVTVFEKAGLAPWLETPPETLVDEQAVATLHRTVREHFAFETAQLLMADAGRRTGAYILANRIPRPARLLLPRLPAALAGRILLRAITQHAWTFAGSGRFSAQPVAGRRRSWDLLLADNPLARTEQHPQRICAWHTAVFASLFNALLRGSVEVEETACVAAGDDGCRFRVTCR